MSSKKKSLKKTGNRCRHLDWFNKQRASSKPYTKEDIDNAADEIKAYHLINGHSYQVIAKEMAGVPHKTLERFVNGEATRLLDLPRYMTWLAKDDHRQGYLPLVIRGKKWKPYDYKLVIFADDKAEVERVHTLS